jgi:inner membrane protein
MYWWLWLVLGLGLLTLEMLTPGGFYVLFFGVGALVVGTLVGLGAAGPVWLQWLLFSVISVVSLLVFRPYLLRVTHSQERPDPMDTLEGEIAMPLEDISPGSVGKAELRGTTWTAVNQDSRMLGRGQRCRVARVDGLTLSLRAE